MNIYIIVIILGILGWLLYICIRNMNNYIDNKLKQ